MPDPLDRTIIKCLMAALLGLVCFALAVAGSLAYAAYHLAVYALA